MLRAIAQPLSLLPPPPPTPTPLLVPPQRNNGPSQSSTRTPLFTFSLTNLRLLPLALCSISEKRISAPVSEKGEPTRKPRLVVLRKIIHNSAQHVVYVGKHISRILGVVVTLALKQIHRFLNFKHAVDHFLFFSINPVGRTGVSKFVNETFI